MPWITVNGAHILIGEDGQMKGTVGAKIQKASPRQRLTIDQAQYLMKQRGMSIDFSSSQIIGGKTHYNVPGKGIMSAKAIQKMLSK